MRHDGRMSPGGTEVRGEAGGDGLRLMALDTATLYYRAYYGLPESMTAPDGTPVNAVRGLLDMVATLVTRMRPAAVVAAWDADWRPEFRVAAVPSYKTHRVDEPVNRTVSADDEPVPDTLSPQIDIIRQVLPALGIPVVAAEGFEADDVLGTLAHHLPQLPVTSLDIVTGDRDLFQLVDDAADVRVLYTARGITNLEVMTESAITRRFGIPGRAYAVFAALRGDASDGLPGVAGVGEKTAASLAANFHTLEDLRAAIAARDERIAPRVLAKLDAAADYLAVIDPVVHVATHAHGPLPEWHWNAHGDSDLGRGLADHWGLGGSVPRLQRALATMTAQLRTS